MLILLLILDPSILCASLNVVNKYFLNEQTNEEIGGIKFTELYRANGIYLLAHSR